MPTYVYRCQSCDIVQEAVQKITEDPLTTCEECGGSVRRVMQPVGIVFKGSGFYVTDYKRAESAGNGKSADSSNGKSADATPSKSESGETKPAAEKAEKKDTAKPVAAAS
jgi:putative FmdB family regulatory protein